VCGNSCINYNEGHLDYLYFDTNLTMTWSIITEDLFHKWSRISTRKHHQCLVF